MAPDNCIAFSHLHIFWCSRLSVNLVECGMIPRSTRCSTIYKNWPHRHTITLCLICHPFWLPSSEDSPCFFLHLVTFLSLKSDFTFRCTYCLTILLWLSEKNFSFVCWQCRVSWKLPTTELVGHLTTSDSYNWKIQRSCWNIHDHCFVTISF